MKIITYLQLEQVKGINPRSTLKQLVKKGIKTNFETKVTPHTLRHSFAIYLLNHVKKPIKKIQTLLGIPTHINSTNIRQNQ